MNATDVEEITMRTLNRVGLSISRLTSFKPKMKTKEVEKYLGCDRKWLYKNLEVFGGERINRRGDYHFETEKVVSYLVKKKQL
ncbi:hypothetical protein [uncultured Salegentibacter sp.]|uniref:hypothetical protein n=1 Tax=uncultured Salegentibacter sp. TaxID=259320 RepID=UPI0025933C06|nr:hypothetical protein [uncultured Salegentibacter sp.]